MDILSISGIRIHALDLSVEHTFLVSLLSIDNHSTVRTCMKRSMPSYEVSSHGESLISELTMTSIDNKMC
jgi:hypothetical protein